MWIMSMTASVWPEADFVDLFQFYFRTLNQMYDLLLNQLDNGLLPNNFVDLDIFELSYGWKLIWKSR